jgi:hypothetical protein
MGDLGCKETTTVFADAARATKRGTAAKPGGGYHGWPTLAGLPGRVVGFRAWPTHRTVVSVEELILG